MLNRRILRVKAMQALYSYFTAQESLKDVVRGRLESRFLLDPAKDDFAQAEEFAARQKEAARLFGDYLQDGKVIADTKAEAELLNAVNEAIASYHKELKREESAIKNTMLADIDGIFKTYLKLVVLPIELAHIEKLEEEKKQRAYIYKDSPWRWHFMNNPLIDALTKSESFSKALIAHKISWANELDQLKTWYKEIIRQDAAIQAYQQTEKPTTEDHQGALMHLYKKLIFKNESIGEFLAESDLHWSENKPILKSLVIKTYQDYQEDLDPAFELKEVSKNEEEDLEFFERLYIETIARSKDLDKIIADKIKNWDITRVALTDRIILKMSLTEMILFHSIPVKVTINEFIEISKLYSTPKSKQFVNGILDVLANELTSEGIIKKSGRGLIDNK